MKAIDIHAHIIPRGLWKAAETKRDWYGYRHEPGEGLGTMLCDGKRTAFNSPKVRFTPEERMGAVLFFHPQPQHNFLAARTTKYGLFNSLGVIMDDAIAIGLLIHGGILDACPELKVCIAHGGGPACYAMGRMDRAWHALPAERRSIPQPPSSYQRRLYYDTVVGSEKALRFLLDEVGADRVVLGSDWPFVPWHPSPVAWLQGLKSITAEEKEKILWRNLETLLKL